MFGNVLTYDAYHLGLYLCSALAWGMLGLRCLLRGTGLAALLRCCAMFAVALLLNGVMLLLDIRRVLDHAQVEVVLLVGGVLLPVALMFMYRAGIIASKKSLDSL